MKKNTDSLYSIPPDINEYENHVEYLTVQELDSFYWKAFRMLKQNRIEGDYLEFGCGNKCRSFRLAYKHNTLQPYSNRMLYAFDSFEGLPKIDEDENDYGWKEGDMAISITEFISLMQKQGAVIDKDYKCVKGFYEDSLKKEPSYYNILKASLVHIDCDLYDSAVSVLKFIKPLLQAGTIITFDDWYLYKCSKNRGEQKAFYEFASENSSLFNFTPYLNYHWRGYSFVTEVLNSKGGQHEGR